MEGNKCIRLYADQAQIGECKKKVKANAQSFSQLSKVLELAGNEVRLKILYLLEEENELCPCDISDILGMSIPAVSQHLRKIERWKYYRIKKGWANYLLFPERRTPEST